MGCGQKRGRAKASHGTRDRHKTGLDMGLDLGIGLGLGQRDGARHGAGHEASHGKDSWGCIWKKGPLKKNKHLLLTQWGIGGISRTPFTKVGYSLKFVFFSENFVNFCFVMESQNCFFFLILFKRNYFLISTIFNYLVINILGDLQH